MWGSNMKIFILGNANPVKIVVATLYVPLMKRVSFEFLDTEHLYITTFFPYSFGLSLSYCSVLYIDPFVTYTELFVFPGLSKIFFWGGGINNPLVMPPPEIVHYINPLQDV